DSIFNGLWKGSGPLIRCNFLENRRSYGQLKRFLVIGGAGFIGSNIVDRLMVEGEYVRVLDDLSNGHMANINQWTDSDRFDLTIGDMRVSEVVRDALENIDVVYLQAAKVSIPLSVENPHLVLDVNIMGTTVVLEEARKADTEKIMVASSSSVYGDTPILPKTEDMPTNPISPYGVSKLSQEHLSMAFAHTYGMDISALRYFNVYGPRQRGGHYAGVIQIFITSALENKPLTIYGDGQQTRDFTYVEDVVEANILAANSKKVKGRVFNVGCGNPISINHLADAIITLTESSSKKEYGLPRLGDVKENHAGLERITSEIGYTPSWNIEQGLANTVDWIRKDNNKVHRPM
ncbi:MAG: NAD-dependent epimerase/dehydratase family protein, partial [Candidatus Thorarchaeota archaeon]